MKKIRSALISVFYKDGLQPLAEYLHQHGVTIYSTGGTRDFIERLNIPCVPVESITGFPSILGGRVKTLHPLIFGAILGKRNDETHINEMKEFQIPEFDLVIVDLYPFEETVSQHRMNGNKDESAIIEKIDIGGPSMIRAAAKNHQDVVVVADRQEYETLQQMLQAQDCQTNIEQRRFFARKAFDVCSNYDNAISNYFNQTTFFTPFHQPKMEMRYGENPHQDAAFYGKLNEVFLQLNGKDLSYNNLNDVEAAIQLIREFEATTFAIIKHTNVCGAAQAETVKMAWDKALAGDPESAFGGVLVCNDKIDLETAAAIHDLFFEVIIAPEYGEDALGLLQSKKNRIVLQLKKSSLPTQHFKSMLNGILMQQQDVGSFMEWKETGGIEATSTQKSDLAFANIICKHLKSNAIALVKDRQLIGKGCGQTSRIDALRHAIEKAEQFHFDLHGAVMASDAFFPFDDCVKLSHEAGIKAFIQPGGSIRDADSINYCKAHELAMVITGMRHFKH
jgi:phosphoribosylaminoimidazolecarboxamide formyltransferase/IMP cyclohydrolase